MAFRALKWNFPVEYVKRYYNPFLAMRTKEIHKKVFKEIFV